MTEDTDIGHRVETIEILSETSDPIAKWTPTIGKETLALLEHLKLTDEDSRKLQSEAVSVLSRCVPPNSPAGRDTGLVVGYVQSGKTMSFTTVAALARDNGYRLIVIITGVSRPLFRQSSERLEKDLRIRDRHDRAWQFFDNPRARPEVKQRIGNAIDWSVALPGVEKQTVLITVMKNTTHLNHLIKLLQSLPLVEVPALVIDDEADQASLNTNVQSGSQSATYRRIVQIRDQLPHHTFLQYTATPQAVLLINVIDVLSPGFAELLTPGVSYTGGKAFFEGDFRLVRGIPFADIPSANNNLTSPPQSLLEAMQVFFLGVAVGRIDDLGVRNRSMMVHPSKKTMVHADYYTWVTHIQKLWKQTLALASSDPDKRDLIEDFRRAYIDLCQTVVDIPSFDTLVPYLEGAVARTIVTAVNAAQGSTPQVDWHQDYSHILVGGEALNRGYTVEGLTVTYMPRGRGVGNADTIEQRARWFGYKSDYLGYCRVYLSGDTLNAYKNYVAHEEDIREQLRKHRATTRSLQDWRRAFFLSPDMRPTRDNVLDVGYIRGNYANDWYVPIPSLDPSILRANWELTEQFREGLELHPDEGHNERTESMKHLVSQQVGLKWVFQELLTKYRVTNPSESSRLYGFLLQVGRYLDIHCDAPCTIYVMSPNYSRERTLKDDGAIENLFQGPHPDRKGAIYPGDRLIRAPRGLTLQLHTLVLKTQKGDVVGEKAVVFGAFVPSEMSANWLVQDLEDD